MKLIYCPHCNDLVRLQLRIKRCKCRKCCGFYLEDASTTAVVNKDAIVVGIDNNTFLDATKKYFRGRERWPETRVDFFFTGWIPTFPGEVVVLDTTKDVKNFDPSTYTKSTISTMPNSPEEVIELKLV